MGDLLQILKGTSTAPIVTFEANGVGQNLDSGLPVVTLTRPDGTAGPAAGTITSLGSGQYSFVVAAQANPTWLDYTAVGTIGGQPQTLGGRVEWLGATLFNISAFRAFKVGGDTPFVSTATPPFTDRQLMDARTAVLEELEAILGFSPVPRFRRQVLNGDGSTSLILPDLFATDVLSVTVNGVTQTISGYQTTTANQIEAITNYGYGTAFTPGRRNVVVEYVAGWERVVGIGRDAAMVMAASELLPDGLSNAVSVTTPDGISYSYEPSETGRGGYQRWTGIRKLDRWLNRHSQQGLAVA